MEPADCAKKAKDTHGLDNKLRGVVKLWSAASAVHRNGFAAKLACQRTLGYRQNSRAAGRSASRPGHHALPPCGSWANSNSHSGSMVQFDSLSSSCTQTKGTLSSAIPGLPETHGCRGQFALREPEYGLSGQKLTYRAVAIASSQHHIWNGPQTASEGLHLLPLHIWPLPSARQRNSAK